MGDDVLGRYPVPERGINLRGEREYTQRAVVSNVPLLVRIPLDRFVVGSLYRLLERPQERHQLSTEKSYRSSAEITR